MYPVAHIAQAVSAARDKAAMHQPRLFEDRAKASQFARRETGLSDNPFAEFKTCVQKKQKKKKKKANWQHGLCIFGKKTPLDAH
jgi:hypothetical protein